MLAWLVYILAVHLAAPYVPKKKLSEEIFGQKIEKRKGTEVVEIPKPVLVCEKPPLNRKHNNKTP